MGLVEDTIKAYDFSAEDYISKHGDIETIKNWADAFVGKLNGMKILDVGCGPGRDLEYFSSLGLEVTGIDLVPEFLGAAKKKVPDAKLYHMDMREMDFNDNYFDGIWSCASFLHLPKSEHEGAMKEHARVLSPNGLMYMSVMGGGKGDDPLPASPKYGGLSKYFYSFGKDEFRELLTSSGFSIEDAVKPEEKPTTRNPVTFLNVLARKI
ncbi:MAG: methyltransferase domain-containing protein [Nanoarchaeota archaeon]